MVTPMTTLPEKIALMVVMPNQFLITLQPQIKSMSTAIKASASETKRDATNDKATTAIVIIERFSRN